MQEFLFELSTNHLILAYILIVVIAILEGPVLSILLGISLKLGYFSPIPLITVLMTGDIIGDIIWYGIGRRYGMSFVNRFGKYLNVTTSTIEKLTVLFHTHRIKILFFSKVTNGLGFSLAVLITAGMTKIPFLKYVGINIIGQIIWTTVLVGLGYFFSHMYSTFDTIFGYITTTAIIIGIFFVFKGYRDYLKTQTERNEI